MQLVAVLVAARSIVPNPASSLCARPEQLQAELRPVVLRFAEARYSMAVEPVLPAWEPAQVAR
jgi:hypothetical protein